jgi:hypothetical protein
VNNFLREIGLLILEASSGGKPIFHANSERIIIRKEAQSYITIKFSNEVKEELIRYERELKLRESHLQLVD